MKPLDHLILSPESWRPIEPLSGRSSNRTSERELERIPTCVVTARGEFPVKLWDYSPIGLAILSVHGPAESAHFNKGDSLKMRFQLGSQVLEADCQIVNIGIHKGGLRVGLSRKDLPERPIFDSVNFALPISSDLKIAGEMTNPFLYGEWCSMSLAAVHPGMRFAFTSNDPTLILFPGQEISIDLALPSSGENTYRGRIIALGRLGEHVQTFLLEPIEISANLTAELAELLAIESGITPDTLRKLGFPIRFLRDRLIFRYAETMDDCANVLALKREACLDEGRPVSSATPEALFARPNRNSRILCAYQEEKLVAAATLSFPGSKKDLLRAETTLGDEGLPEWVPPKSDLMEVHSVILHPDYRKGDLLSAMVEHIARAFVLSDRNFIIKACPERLLAQHRRMGFRAPGEAYIHNSGREHLLLLDKNAVIYGKGISTAKWLALFGDLATDLLEKGLVEPAGWTGITTKFKLRLKSWLQGRTRSRSEILFHDFLFDNRKPNQ